MMSRKTCQDESLILAVLAACVFLSASEVRAQIVTELRHGPFADQNSQRVEYLSPSPDGKYLIGVNRQGITLWSADELQQLWTRRIDLMTHNTLPSAAFSADGQQVAVVRNDGTVVRMRTSDGRQEASLNLQEALPGFSPTAVQLSPDGTKLILADWGQTIVCLDWKRPQSARRIRPFSGQLNSMLLTPDGTRLLTGGEEEGGPSLKMWNVETGELVASTRWQKGRITALAQSRDGKTLATRSNDATVKIYDNSGSELRLRRTIPADSYDYGISLSNDGRYLAVPVDGACVIHDLSNKQPFAKFPALVFRKVCLVNEGRQLAACHYSDVMTVPVYNLQSLRKRHEPQSQRTIGEGDEISQIGVTGDGKKIGLRVYDQYLVTTPSGAAPTGLKDLYSNAATALTSDGRVLLYDRSDERKGSVWQWYLDRNRIYRLRETAGKRVTCLATPADGGLVAMSFYDGGVSVISADGKGAPLLEWPADSVNRLAISPDHRWLAIDNRSVTVVDLESKEEMIRIEPEGVAGFSTDSRYLFGAAYRSVWRLDLQSGALEYPFGLFQTNYGLSASAMAIMPGSDIVAIASDGNSSGYEIRLWNGRNGNLLVNLSGHINSISSLCFSPDRKTLYSGDDNGHLFEWDISTWSSGKPADADTSGLASPAQVIRSDDPRVFQTDVGIEVQLRPAQPATVEEFEQALRDVLFQLRESTESRN